MSDPTHEVQSRAKLGPPYEDEGTCELCNEQRPTWMVEDGESDEQLPFCAACILQALPKATP